MKKAPQPKMVTMFKGIKGLVASGPGMTKKVDHAKVRPEKNEGAMIKHPPMKMMPTVVPTKTSAKMMPHGKVNVSSRIRPEGPIKRDSASTVKP